MARRAKGVSSASGGLILVVAIIALITSKVYGLLGPFGIMIGLAAAVFVPLAFSRYNRRHKLAYLRARYSDEQTVQQVFAHKFWNGQTEAQLLDSLGAPREVETKVLVTRKRQVWKYQQVGKNRYRLRITLDNGLVTGWEQK